MQIHAYYRIIGDKKAFLTVYVDDIVLASNFPKEVQRIKGLLKNKFKMSDLGAVHHLLGMTITRDSLKGTISLSQSLFAKNIISRFSNHKVLPYTLPALPTQSLNSAQCIDEENSEQFTLRRQL